MTREEGNGKATNALDDFRDIHRLLVYLYTGNGREVEVSGVFPGTKYRFRLGDDLDIEENYLSQINEEEATWMGYRRVPSSPRHLINIIKQLKHLPPTESTEAGFTSRWEEISAAADAVTNMA